ncbi:MAG TPA: helix-turn-helix domain-containing protein [Streptosporangiaceae bacterium]
MAGDSADNGAAVDMSSEVVDEITWYMREHKVSRADLASALGVPPGRVSQILSGGERLTPRTLGSVLTALGARLEISLTPATEHAHG